MKRTGEIIESFMLVRNPDFPFNMFVECGEIDLQFMIGKYPVEINCDYGGTWRIRLSKEPYDFSIENIYGECIIGTEIVEVQYNDVNCVTIFGETETTCTTIVVGE